MEATNDKKSHLQLDMGSKILFAQVHGFFKPEDATAFVEEYTNQVKKINASEFELHFDSKELKVSSQDMVPMLIACFEMYQKDGFKKIVFDCGTSASLKMQIRRVSSIVGLTNYEII